MKKIFYLVSFLFFCQLALNGQANIDWQRVAAPDSSLREFRYMSRGGHLYFVDKYTDKTYASFDYGKSWELLSIPFITGSAGALNPFNKKAEEDAEGNLYFIVPKYFKVSGGYASNSSQMYKFNLMTKVTELVQDFITLPSIRDYKFINDTDLIFTTSKKIVLYDTKQRKIKKEVAIKINSSDARIYFSKGYKTYINLGDETNGSKHVFQAINDTLGFVDSKFEFPFFYGLYYSKGRFFRPYDAKYSDDEGKTWQQLSNFELNVLTFEIGHNGQIFGENNSHYLYSKNNGDSTQILGDYDYHWITCDTAGVLLKTTKSYCRDPKVSYISHDEGKHWEEIRPNLHSKPYAQSVNAGVNGNLFALDNCSTGLCYTKVENNWKSPLSKFNYNFHTSPILELPNGGLFVSENYRHYFIHPEYDSMSICNFNFIVLGDRKIKNGKLFLNSGYQVYVSEDFLNLKNTYNFNGSGVNSTRIASNDRLFQKLSGILGWSLYDLNTKIRIPLDLPISTQEIESGYANNNIYALSFIPTGVGNIYDYYLHQSTDGGLSFAKILVSKNLDDRFISMTVDHNENIYLLFEHKLFVSINEGLTWFDITPKSPDLIKLTGISVSYDNYIYLSTLGLGIVKTDVLSSNNVNYLHVKAIRDESFNCLKDFVDTSKVTGIVRLSSGYEKPLNINGEAWVSFPGDSVEVFLDVNKHAEVCSNNKKVFANKSDSLLFLVKLIECEDLKFGLSTSFLRRCFDNTYIGFVKNEGSISSERSTLNVTLDSLFEFVSSNLEVLSYNHPYLKLVVPSIEVGNSMVFELKVHVKCDALLGQEHCIYADIESKKPCAGDSRYPYKECRINGGSYDPNDKAIFVSGRKDEPHFTQDDKIEYLIRFQNTGTDTAFTVKIEDFISPKYDITTLRPVAASHHFDWEIRPNRNLVVYFNDILLVDSFKNEPNSHGFIKFEIKLDTNVVILGDTVSNNANIYFDFNEAVVTNTVTTINGLPNSTKDVTNDPTYILYPNPTHTHLNVRKTDQLSGEWHINLYNSSGMLLHKQGSNTSEAVIDLTDYQSGFYIVKISSGKRIVGYKVLKM